MPHPRPSTVPSRPAATRRRLERTLAAGLGLLLALPLVQQLTGFPRDLPLTGAEARTPPPTWSAAAWFDGTFAAQAEQWSLERIGFRGLLIHLATQANYSLFGRIGLPGGTEVVEGRDHWLFERAYIKWAMRPQGYSQARAASFADQAARLQEALARRGIAFARYEVLRLLSFVADGGGLVARGGAGAALNEALDLLDVTAVAGRADEQAQRANLLGIEAAIAKPYMARDLIVRLGEAAARRPSAPPRHDEQPQASETDLNRLAQTRHFTDEPDPSATDALVDWQDIDRTASLRKTDALAQESSPLDEWIDEDAVSPFLDEAPAEDVDTPTVPPQDLDGMIRQVPLPSVWQSPQDRVCSPQCPFPECCRPCPVPSEKEVIERR